MSCDYCVYCVDCADCHDEGSNHGDDIAAALIRLAPAIIQLAPHLAAFRKATDDERTASAEVCLTYGYQDARLDVGWFVLHAGHRLMVRNEYGGLSDECAEYFSCSGCRCKKRCLRSKGHTGEHSNARESSTA
jgi:hypothetical protein